MSEPAIDLLPVAKVIKSFGIKGEMLIRYSPRFKGEIDEKRPVFINYDGIPVPFFIEGISPKGTDQALLRLEGVFNETQIAEITGEFIYIESSQIQDDDQEEGPSQFIGYTIADEAGKAIGIIREFYDYPGNPCFGISRNDKKEEELLLPIHEEIIIAINDKSKKITARIPEGLLEL
jgi:16S rRNA processing protein RimM